jgi:hypothetical protein
MKKILVVLVLTMLFVWTSPSQAASRAENIVQTDSQIPNVKCNKVEGSIGTNCIWNGLNYDYVFLLSYVKEDVLSREENQRVIVGTEQTENGLVIKDINGFKHTISNSEYKDGLLTITIDGRTLRVSKGALIELVFYVSVHPKHTQSVPFSYLYSPAENAFVTCEKYSCGLPNSAVKVEFTAYGVVIQELSGNWCAMPINKSSLEAIVLAASSSYFGSGRCPQVY